jgi:hypothetical protein
VRWSDWQSVNISDCAIIKCNYELCAKVVSKFNTQSETPSRVTLPTTWQYTKVGYAAAWFGIHAETFTIEPEMDARLLFPKKGHSSTRHHHPALRRAAWRVWVSQGHFQDITSTATCRLVGLSTLSNRFLRNIGAYLPNYTVSHPWRQLLSSTYRVRQYFNDDGMRRDSKRVPYNTEHRADE